MGQMKKAAAFAAVLVMAITMTTPAFAGAGKTEDASAESSTASSNGALPDYDEYAAKFDSVYTGEIIEPVPSGMELKDGGFLLKGGQRADFKVNVREEGLYRISFEYKAATEEKNNWNMSLEIDGELPFSGADSLVLNRLWKNKEPIVHKEGGNDVRPEIVQEFIWQPYEVRDIEAMLQESQRNVNGTAILELRPLSFSTVGVESEDDLVKTKFGEYGEMQKGWTAEDAKGFIKVTSTPLRVYYNNHKDEEI